MAPMYVSLLFLCVIAHTSSYLVTSDSEEASNKLINYINEQPKKLWKAGPIKRFSRSLELARRQLRPIPNVQLSKEKTVAEDLEDDELPSSFDAREQWPYCKSIGEIRDESACSSHWAVSAVSAMSDRLCIHSEGRINVTLSARDLLSCCDYCGQGCWSGSLPMAWDFWVKHGIVTGGSLEQGTGCQPYPFPKCKHTAESHGDQTHCPQRKYPTPVCLKTCKDGYGKSYEDDKYFGQSTYKVERNPKAIMREIMQNGPVTSQMIAFEDFLHYESGIYEHCLSLVGFPLLVRILGWGTDAGVPYWLVANSWNENWGENGFFRIRRGVDECGIESYVVAGLPRI